MGLFRQEYWSGLPFSSPGDLPNPRIEFLHCRQMLYHLSHQGSPYKETNHLSKAPSPTTITYEVRILTYEYGGDMQSIEPPHFLLFPLKPKVHEGKDFVCCVFCCVSSAKQWIVRGGTPLVSVDWINVSLCRPPHYDTSWGHSGRENPGHWPQIVEVHVKGMTSGSPNSCIFPIHRKALNSLTWDVQFSLISSNLLMFQQLVFVAKTPISAGSSLSLRSTLSRVIWEAVYWA